MPYPVILLRVRASLIDGIVFACVLFVLVALASIIDFSEPALKVCFVVVPLILMEPLLISTTGGSVGHHIVGLRVVGKKTQKKLFILNSIVRLIAKTVFGIYSLAAMFITKQHQSVHDLLSRSVVVFRNEASVPERHKLYARDVVHTEAKASIIRRFFVVLAYLVLVFVVLLILPGLLVSPDCIRHGFCSEAEQNYLGLLAIVSVIAVLLVVFLGFQSRLPGAYYRRVDS